MEKITWCLKVKNGIELVEPNANLSEGYIIKAEEALETSKLAKSKEWRISAAYYTIYFSLYSLLMRIGIKCEIHTCTIEFAKQFLKDYLSQEDLKLMDSAFQARNDSQYYVDRSVPDETFNLLMEKAPEFLAKCKNIALTEDEIQRIRKKLQEIMK